MSFTVAARVRVAEKLDNLVSITSREVGQGAIPETWRFRTGSSLNLKHSKIAAFGSTRRAKVSVEEDAQVNYY